MPLLFSFENIHRHYLKCRRNKRNTHNALRFEARQELNLLELQAQLQDRSYRPTRSVCFFATRPKLREIFAADFRDRVVHHILVDYLERIWEPVFIHDSFACRKGKGVHAGVKRLQRFLHQATANGTRTAWYLQLDIRNYFMTIDKAVLLRLLAAKIRDDDALWLTRLLVFHDCTEDFILRGNPALLESIPSHKTLFNTPVGKGLPIGNLNSQFFANVYLNVLDQFVKHELKCRHYLRYCDDFVMLANSPAQLPVWKERIEAFLAERLKLELNPARQRLAPVTNGIDFLGYIVRRDYLLVRRRVVNHLKEKLRDYEQQLVEQRDGVCRYRFDEAVLDRLHATLSSYLGHFKLANTQNLWQAIWRKHPFLGVYFQWNEENRKLVRKYKTPKGFERVQQQYHYFRWRFPDDVLFFQVGRFYEFYQLRDASIADLLQLAPMGRNRRGARFGFPVSQFNHYLGELLKRRIPVLVIQQHRQYWTGIQGRGPAWRYEGLNGSRIPDSYREWSGIPPLS